MMLTIAEVGNGSNFGCWLHTRERRFFDDRAPSFAIPSEWTAEQAMAVIALLDELREHISGLYERELTEAYRELYGSAQRADEDAPLIDDEPF